eukprot:SAG31_NODE_49444_length_139_cov_272.475000_1_plen_31_part_01
MNLAIYINIYLSVRFEVQICLEEGIVIHQLK